MLCGKSVERVFQKHVAVQRIVFGCYLVLGVGIVDGNVHVGFLREEFAYLETGSNTVFILVVVSSFVDSLFQSAESARLNMPVHGYGGKIRQLYIQFCLGCHTAVLGVVLKP